jgi:hypothetical protein
VVSRMHYSQGRQKKASGRPRKTENMSCRDTIHLICWYLEHRLSPTVEHEIAQHLEQCADCRLVLEAATLTLDRYFGSSESGETKAASRAA